MSAETDRLRTYECKMLLTVQLAQVDDALRVDSGNSELQSLRDELADLIDLTRQFVEQQKQEVPQKRATSTEASAESTVPVHQEQFTAGQEVTARYHEDGKFYPARVVSVAGTADNPLYTILFHKYGNTQVSNATDLRVRKGPLPTRKQETPRPASRTIDDKERERRRLRNEKKRAREASRVQEHAERQNAWLKFAKKGQKKGYGISGDKSMFKTPDDPYAKGKYKTQC